ncbi:uncharacterized protein LOC131663415 [Phymastichus coffea]|uniref:uncharacterized protein LOC131663415 n=1 Tax=Phymastichus coffea TaxID=108790 RepID=UPI00273AA5A7|nr:uncharacterized protein LOC131663415 [Phymastichus coffea]
MASDGQDTGQQAMEGASTLTPRTSRLIDIRNTLYKKLDLATTRVAEGIYLAERSNETGFCLVFTSRFETITSDPKTLHLREREVVAKATITVPQAIKTLIAETKANRAHSEEQFWIFGEKIEQVGDKIARAIAEAFKGLSVPPPTALLTAPTPATTVSVETLTSQTPPSMNARSSPAARVDSNNPVRAARAGTADQPTEVARAIDSNAPSARQSCRRTDPAVDARATQALSWRRQADELLRQSVRASNRRRSDSSSVEDGELPDDGEDWDAENEVPRDRTSARSGDFARTRLFYDETVS